jgi:hypothetical protein
MTVTYPTAQQLMARAQEQTGLSDFGKPTFLTGLNRFLQSLEEDANLTEAGRDAVMETTIRRLRGRLNVEHWYSLNPGVAQQAIKGPISITGLPRTGTTALCSMMSLDPQFRCLRMWEQMEPTPPPVLEVEQEDPRRLAYIHSLEELFRRQPEQKTMHLYEVDATVEDGEIMGLESMYQQTVNPVFGFLDWWRDADLIPTYAYHRRVMLLLQTRRPPNLWFFKAPHHKFHLEAFLHAYPNARFVFTHRDPAKIVPSYASLITSLYPPGSKENIDPTKVGRFISAHLRAGMEHAIAARQRLGDDRFIDIHHREMVADPLGTLDRIYAFLGYELTPAVRAAIATWSAQNRSGAHGVHRYTAEEFGLSADQIRSDYAFYIRHFDVKVER